MVCNTGQQKIVSGISDFVEEIGGVGETCILVSGGEYSIKKEGCIGTVNTEISSEKVEMCEISKVGEFPYYKSARGMD